ncbi:uncharacterized protein N7484_005717 [Penicillium longicatenatum]|uniref:uncharacterized protein n=1 Tax=Penicillium longicatenatum TaxID=1561947 RepID=UPI002548F83E|nr:uncharacterized protein N7484_005717 [Penicillium longicatenatum]KAJ5643210.1 hypothetical protein N7484_005717 [Penicillium longicatenatum]
MSGNDIRDQAAPAEREGGGRGPQSVGRHITKFKRGTDVAARHGNKFYAMWESSNTGFDTSDV